MEEIRQVRDIVVISFILDQKSVEHIVKQTIPTQKGHPGQIHRVSN